MSEPERNPIREAEVQLAEGDAHGAFQTLRWVFRETDLYLNQKRMAQALGVLAPIGRALADDKFGDLVGRAANDLNSVQALYDLGYNFFEQGLHDLAACVLYRAHHLAPGTESIVTELVAALEEDGRNEEALSLLASEPDVCDKSFICRYLIAFNAIMSAELKLAHQAADSLDPKDNSDHVFMAQRIAAMLARVEHLKGNADLGPNDLRGWHYVSTAGALLHLSPYGFAEGMRGRYAFTQDSYSRCRHVLTMLQDLLSTWDYAPVRILAMADKDSQVLARAAAKLLDLPVDDYHLDKGGLIVAYDLASLPADTPREFFFHRPDQVLFTQAASWTDPPMCAPDILGYLYQAQQLAWGESMIVSPDGQMTTKPASDEPLAVLADKILEAEPDPELSKLDSLEQVQSLWRAMKVGAGAFGAEGRRSPLWAGGPVKSSRFG